MVSLADRCSLLVFQRYTFTPANQAQVNIGRAREKHALVERLAPESSLPEPPRQGCFLFAPHNSSPIRPNARAREGWPAAVSLLSERPADADRSQ